MYKRYGQVALKAYSMIISENKKPRESWECSDKEAFPESKAFQNKSCTKETFLELCEAGFLIDITSGNYTKSVTNKEYSIKALKTLYNDSSIEKSLDLWCKQHNQQMDVILALFKNDLIDWSKLK